jgi:CheY-like chemotaxis protein
MKFLIVDDDDNTGRIMSEVFTNEFGAEVSVVSTEREFRERLGEFSADPPDLVVMDIMLPWDTPRLDTLPPPEDVLEGGFEGAGWRCVALLAQDAGTARVPIVISTIAGPDTLRGARAATTARVFFHAKTVGLGSLLILIRSILRAGFGVSDKGRAVFVAHGHDERATEAVARFLEKLGQRAVVLREQAAEGKTVIEQLEAHSDVSYAVVLLTPDDLGSRAGSADAPRPRARQNVIFEFGYLLARLGRDKVCVLVGEGVEVPSDYGSVLFIGLDGAGGWKSRLAAEMRRAGLPIDLNRMA